MCYNRRMLCRRCFLPLLFTILATVGFAHAQTCTALSLEGSGTSESPFLIATADDFLTLTNELNHLDGSVEAACWSAHYEVTNDIDLGIQGYAASGSANLQCNPIGVDPVFSGTFDGGGHVIANGYLNPSGTGCEGLFTMVRGATFQDLTFSGVDASLDMGYTAFTGMVAGGAAESTFRNVHVEGGDVHGSVAGGLVGKGYSTDASRALRFENVGYDGTVRAVGIGGGLLIGWIADGGATPVHIEGAVVDGTVTGASESVGGLAGFVEGPVAVHGATIDGTIGTGSNASALTYRGGAFGYVDVSSTPDVEVLVSGVDVRATVSEEDRVGGLVGRVDGSGVDADRLTVRNARLEGTVRGYEDVGGVVGRVTDATVDVDGYVSTPTAEVEGSGSAGLVAGELFRAHLTIADATVDGTVLGTRTGTSSGDGVGGLVGTGISTPVTVERTRVAADVTGADGAFVGGAVGYLGNTNPASELTARQVTVEGTLTGGGGENVGGVLGYVGLGNASITDVHVASSTLAGDAAAGVVGYAYFPDDAVDVTRAVVRADLAADVARFGIVETNEAFAVTVGEAYFLDADADRGPGTLLTTDGLRDYATFATWDLANGADAGASAVWTFCGNDGPHLTLHAPTDCPPADLASTLQVGVPTSVLRDLPFSVTISAVDAEGAPAPVLETSTLVLTATGGAEAGVLRRVGEPDAPASVDLTAGSAVVTADDLYYTGLSAEAGGDVVVTVSGTSGSAQGLTGTAAATSVRDVALALAYDGGPREADGTDVATVVATLTDADGAPLADRTLTLATTLGTLVVDGAAAGTSAALATDADGTVEVGVRSDVAGTARVTVACPGSCTQEVRIPFLGRQALALVPGDGVAWAYPAPFDDDLTIDAVQYRVDGGTWTDVAEAGLTGPFRIADLTNAQLHEVELRGVAGGTPVALQGPASVTPAAPTPPTVAFDPPPASPTDAAWDGDALRVTADVVLRHDEDADLENVWLVLTPADGATVRTVEPEDGFATREAGGWRWTGSPWPAGTPKRFTVTYDVPAPEGDDE